MPHVSLRADERGFSLVEALFVLGIVVIIGGVLISMSAYGLRHSRAGHARLDLGQAALDAVDHAEALPVGGSISPDRPVEGYSDLVVPDREGYVAVRSADESPDGTAILRQWRVGTTSSGERVVDVSAVVTGRTIVGVDSATYIRRASR